MAEHVQTTLVTFGLQRDRFRLGALAVEVYPALRLIGDLTYDPLNYDFLQELRSADVIHCHQYRTAVTSLAIMAGRALRKRVFVTDLGGTGHHFTERYNLQRWVDGFLPISRFGAKLLPPGRSGCVIYGGVDNAFFEVPLDGAREHKALFVGRMLPHKGLNYLIEGIGSDVPLDVIGQPYNPAYFDLVSGLAAGKCVRFVTDASDAQLRDSYRHALVTILPSVYKDIYGNEYAMPELLGLVLLESMASGTPVICTDVASMPEFVEDGVTGFIVPPNDPVALGERVRYLVTHPDVALEMGRRGRELVLQRYTWEAVAQRCLAAYADCTRIPTGKEA